eukprot:4757536-Alexandrium_andersonii.AAC.1
MEPWASGTRRGCEHEALYSSCPHGRLAASCNAERGERSGSHLGVYVHKQATARKAAPYKRFAPL